MALSPFSDDVVPHLAEKDARFLAEKVVERVRALGVLPASIGVTLDREGMWFAARINGKNVSARTGEGGFTYEQIARELVLASVDPGWDALTVEKG